MKLSSKDFDAIRGFLIKLFKYDETKKLDGPNKSLVYYKFPINDFTHDLINGIAKEVCSIVDDYMNTPLHRTTEIFIQKDIIKFDWMPTNKTVYLEFPESLVKYFLIKHIIAQK